MPRKKSKKGSKKKPAKSTQKDIKGKIGKAKRWVSKEIGIPLNGNVKSIAKHRYKKGRKELEHARKEAIKRFNPKVVEEFDKLAKKNAKNLKAMPEKIMEGNIRVKGRIVHNIKKLLNPVKTIKNSKK